VTEQLDDVPAASDSLTAEEWLDLIEGAEAQGIEVGLDLLRLALPSLGDVTHIFLSGQHGSLVFAVCRALHRLGHTWDVVDYRGHVPKNVHQLMTAGWGPIMESVTQRLMHHIQDQDWQGLMRAAGTLKALDSILESKGYFVRQGLEGLAAAHADQHGLQRSATLVAASHLISHFATPHKTWSCQLGQAISLLSHLPTSSAVTIYTATTRGLSADQDVLSIITLPACAPADLITLAEVLEQTGHGPDASASSKWWAEWRDCMCSLSHAISAPEAARLVTVLAKLQANHHCLTTLLTTPSRPVTGPASSNEGPSSGSAITTNNPRSTATKVVDSSTMQTTRSDTTTAATASGPSLADTICTVATTHLSTLKGHDRAALLSAATVLVLSAQDPAFCLSLAAILREGTQHEDGSVSTSEVAAVLASAHAQAFMPLVQPMPDKEPVDMGSDNADVI
jgi:hypothetical protein